MILPSEPLMEESDKGSRLVLPLEFLDYKFAAEPAEKTVDTIVSAGNEKSGKEMLAELEERLHSQAESIARQVEAARQSAKAEAREELSDALEEKIALERAVVAKVCEQFARERARYFAEVEAEVVRLALAIASQVLHRESTLDPLLLQGAVKVALAKVQEGSMATLRVPEEQTERWKEIVSHERDGVVVAGDKRLGQEECVLETSVGRVELGVRTQLEEIEKGFFDLLERRPS